jgi:hypothetical protein
MDAPVLVAPLQYAVQRKSVLAISPDQPQKQPPPVLELPVASGLAPRHA